MSRNAPYCRPPLWLPGWPFNLALAFLLSNPLCSQTPSPFPGTKTPGARVVVVHDGQATQAFRPVPGRVRRMVDRAILTLSGSNSVESAWGNYVSTQDVVGLKVFSSPGPDTGTRPEVVAAVVEGLLQAQLPPRQIIIWDKSIQDLRSAGFVELAARYGVQVRSSTAAGYDEEAFYENPLLGQLIYGDTEFGRDNQDVGRRSFVSKLVSKELTKIINLAPLRNHNRAGVCGNLYNLTMGSVDNTYRFETAPERLATAVPEIYALPELYDRVVLNIVDALICQYEGEQRSLLHYSTALNEIHISTDPVALDVLSLLELEHQREAAGVTPRKSNLELYQNASLLELGVSNPRHIQVERVEVNESAQSNG